MKTRIKYILALLLPLGLFTLAGCKKDSAPADETIKGGAQLTTAEATFITNTSAQLGGTITDAGSCAVDARGIAISTSHNPGLSDTFYPEAPLTEPGSFTIPVGTLAPNTTYYVRSFATNCKGTAYGNEIQFTTGSGISNSDSTYFKLTAGGITYFSYDILDPVHGNNVFPEGDTRFAFATWDSSNGVFSLASQSSFLMEPAKSFGFSFSYMNPDVNGTGTYSFGKFPSDDKNIVIHLRTSTGDVDPVFNSGYNIYMNIGNFTRHMVDSNCEESEITSAVNTLVISRWGDPGQLIEGTIQGTLYENIKTSFNCQNSNPMSFSVEFRLKRLE